ncbi:MAG: pantoate--beta-alanine ligase [Planctomycetota bacterium]|nr:pantoate--beta-alanine ligase [Planctomycetota bacterium]
MADPAVLKTPDEMRSFSLMALREDKSLGFVPTMGALHAGHKALIERARKENDLVVVSIFVNPTQFGPGEDFEKYPRTFEADEKLCAQAGADAIFFPDKKAMYSENARTFVEVGGLQDVLCGMSRPGHFRGVATVVTKLFNLVRPTRAYFGRKDAQQLRIIQTMTRDLDLPVEVVPCEIVREPDGLAMSSRNKYLSPPQRKQALCLAHALAHCKKAVAGGERDAMKLIGEMAEIVEDESDGEIDYIAIVNAETLDDVAVIAGECLAAMAVKIGQTRLIDNVRLNG